MVFLLNFCGDKNDVAESSDQSELRKIISKYPHLSQLPAFLNTTEVKKF